MKKRDLKFLLVILIVAFLALIGSEVMVQKRNQAEEQELQRQQALSALESVTTPTPTVTPAVTATPTPIPTATPTSIPPEVGAYFSPDDYWGTWYSANGLVSVNIYDITQDSVSFTFSQSYDYADSYVVTGDATGTVYGNAATVSFTDSAGSQAGGSLTFDSGTLYVNIQTTALADGAVVSPGVASVMSRTRVTPSPVPEEDTQTAETYEETEETYTEEW